MAIKRSKSIWPTITEYKHVFFCKHCGRRQEGYTLAKKVCEVCNPKNK